MLGTVPHIIVAGGWSVGYAKGLIVRRAIMRDTDYSPRDQAAWTPVWWRARVIVA